MLNPDLSSGVTGVTDVAPTLRKLSEGRKE